MQRRCRHYFERYPYALAGYGVDIGVFGACWLASDRSNHTAVNSLFVRNRSVSPYPTLVSSLGGEGGGWVTCRWSSLAWRASCFVFRAGSVRTQQHSPQQSNTTSKMPAVCFDSCSLARYLPYRWSIPSRQQPSQVGRAYRDMSLGCVGTLCHCACQIYVRVLLPRLETTETS
jgi:hypothetical protein